MKILTVTTLFPYANDPKHGVFVETRLRQLKAHFPEVEIKVIAPVPWFPFCHSFFGRYSSYAKAPAYEKRFDMDVFHPRFFVLPKIGMSFTPKSLSHAIYNEAKALIDNGFDFDLIDGHYFYPDGVAIAAAAKKLGKPFTITARGTDINFIPSLTKPRRAIQSIFADAGHMMTVCDALKDEMIALGADECRVTTLRNGVDLKLFPFANEAKKKVLRDKLSLPQKKKILLSVGHLIKRKGHHLVIEALRALPNVVLLIAGTGEEEKRLKQLVVKLNVVERVSFLGDLSQSSLAEFYGAADALVLASSREGWANVLLEAMACGTPVVATNIWGTPEVVKARDAGILVRRDAIAIARGIKYLFLAKPAREDTRKYAEQFNWYATSQGQHQIFSRLINKEMKKSTAKLQVTG